MRASRPQQAPRGLQLPVFLPQMHPVCADAPGDFRVVVDDEKTAVFPAQGGKLAAHALYMLRGVVLALS